MLRNPLFFGAVREESGMSHPSLKPYHVGKIFEDETHEELKWGRTRGTTTFQLPMCNEVSKDFNK